MEYFKSFFTSAPAEEAPAPPAATAAEGIADTTTPQPPEDQETNAEKPKKKVPKKKEEPTRKMTCHYEIMELERNCTTDEIKLQFRKLALKWHPDRNHGQEEYATEMFKIVSASHAVLSDPQERRWYDTHRESILRGGDGTNTGEDGEDGGIHCCDLWRYFNSSCYTDFENGTTGFYEVYEGAFAEIHQFEVDAVEASYNTLEAKKKYPLEDPPSIGDAKTTIPELSKFYQYWENFTTKLSFAWEDKYDIREAPNRETKRAMEKENAKSTQKAKKDYSLKVRSLASFVRKRDPRMIAHLAEMKEKKKLEEEEKARKKIEDQKRRKAEREQREIEYRANTVEIESRDRERKKAWLLADHSSSEDEATLIALAAVEEGVDESVTEMSERALQNKLKLLRLQNKQKAESVVNGMHSAATDAASLSAAAAVAAVEDPADGDDEEDLFRCEVCDKSFATEQQLTQHQGSKVHRQKVKDEAKKTTKKKPALKIKKQVKAPMFQG